MIESKNQIPLIQHGNIPDGNAVVATLGEKGQISIRYNVSAWQYNLWDNTGWHNCSDQTSYVPPIPIRAILMIRTGQIEATIEYDSPGYGEAVRNTTGWGYNGSASPAYQTKIINTLPTQVQWVKCPTKIWLAGSSSNFTELYMSA